MADPRLVRPDEVEILIARELRKSGLAISALRALDRRATPADQTGFVIRFAAVCIDHGQQFEALVEFHNEPDPLRADAVTALSHAGLGTDSRDGPVRLIPAPDVGNEPQPPAPRRLMFSTTGYAPDAIRAGSTLGIPLLAVADGPAAFRSSQWSMGDETPAWVPEYMAVLVSLGPDGAERREILTSGKSLLPLS